MVRCESGYYLAREIRALPRLASCRLIAITGFAQDQHRRTSEAAGFHEHLTKPVDDAILFHALESPDPADASTGAAL